MFHLSSKSKVVVRLIGEAEESEAKSHGVFGLEESPAGSLGHRAALHTAQFDVVRRPAHAAVDAGRAETRSGEDEREDPVVGRRREADDALTPLDEDKDFVLVAIFHILLCFTLLYFTLLHLDYSLEGVAGPGGQDFVLRLDSSVLGFCRGK